MAALRRRKDSEETSRADGEPYHVGLYNLNRKIATVHSFTFIAMKKYIDLAMSKKRPARKARHEPDDTASSFTMSLQGQWLVSKSAVNDCAYRYGYLIGCLGHALYRVHKR